MGVPLFCRIVRCVHGNNFGEIFQVYRTDSARFKHLENWKQLKAVDTEAVGSKMVDFRLAWKAQYIPIFQPGSCLIGKGRQTPKIFVSSSPSSDLPPSNLRASAASIYPGQKRIILVGQPPCLRLDHPSRKDDGQKDGLPGTREGAGCSESKESPIRVRTIST